jgi:xanthine dehydrogenase accessory factor
MPAIILIRGGGDLASGVALRLYRAGLGIVISELPMPLAVRRSVAFAEAIYEGGITIEGVTAHAVSDRADRRAILNTVAKQQIAVLIDPDGAAATAIHPLAIVDGRMLKQPPQRLLHEARLLIGLGPGFTAPDNCDAVVETERGHALGRVIWEGQSAADTAQPEGDTRRVLRAPATGLLESHSRIGEHIDAGQIIAAIAGWEISAPFAGVLRGLLRPGTTAVTGMKIGDLDPRDDPRLCQLVSDKSLAVGGGVLEALLTRPEVRSRLWA